MDEMTIKFQEKGYPLLKEQRSQWRNRRPGIAGNNRLLFTVRATKNRASRIRRKKQDQSRPLPHCTTSQSQLRHDTSTSSRENAATHSRNPASMCILPPFYCLAQSCRKSKGTSLTQFARVKRIVSDQCTLKEKMDEMTIKFRERGSDLGGSKESQQVLRPTKNGTFPCLICNCCSNCQRGEVIYHSHKGTPIKIKGHFTCSSTFVVYVIKCPCRLATKKIEQAVACHFIEKGHGVQQLKYQVVDGVPILHRWEDRLKNCLKGKPYARYTYTIWSYGEYELHNIFR
ncbi:hypothetical protein XELAEV_18001118mg [Xenopus laevis]|uniref:Uncharacterized protein n=1 Tax=Xenopus laevis TaxID=8355 RepID=A0A974GZ38_XENLA|nr:hypothetical protein XELAEV_18001118mg [Xenopus laevis]